MKGKLEKSGTQRKICCVTKKEWEKDQLQKNCKYAVSLRFFECAFSASDMKVVVKESGDIVKKNSKFHF